MESAGLTTGLSASTPPTPSTSQAATLSMNFALSSVSASASASVAASAVPTAPSTSALAFEQIFGGLMFPPPTTSTARGLVMGEKGSPTGLPPWIPTSSIGESGIPAGGERKTMTDLHPVGRVGDSSAEEEVGRDGKQANESIY
ncbi:hypothetical protein TcWFU_010175 [Taenia crassiceps]|uniref:Uncharacterized protein n=1 Tax=Taenia crassiceps TaxID=6207 RepID=A0ABR4Q523_9CEST